MSSFTQRYSRQLILKNWSMEKQQLLAQLTVSVPSSLPGTALYLAAAGIGRLVLCNSETWKAHILSFNPGVIVLDKQEDAEKIDFCIELSQTQSAKPYSEVREGSPTKIIAYCDSKTQLYCSALITSKIISAVHTGAIESSPTS